MEIYDPERHIQIPSFIRDACRELRKAKRTISAIKLLRGYCKHAHPAMYGKSPLGLRQAKEYVEIA